MNSLRLLLATALGLLCLSTARANLIYHEDYEGTPPYGLNNGNAHVNVTYTADPVVGGTHGTVAAVDHSPNDQIWGEVRTQPTGNFALPANSIGQPFVLKVDYYIPSSSRFGAEDGLSVITRWNDGTESNSRSFSSGISFTAAIPRDVWQTLTLTGTVPATDTEPAGPYPVTHVVPFISWPDRDPYVSIGVAGIDAYFDNFDFQIIPEPSLLVMLLGGGLIGLFSVARRRRR